MLKPADDYITAFVKEVNRGRVIRAGTVMEPLNGAPRGIAIAADALMEDVARQMTSANQTEGHVLDASGQPIGRLDLKTVASSLVASPARAFKERAT